MAEAQDLVVADMLGATTAAGARLVVAYIPPLARGGTKDPPAALLESVAGRDLTFVDLAPRIREWYADPARSDLTLPDDEHPNAQAHAVMAEALEKVLAPLLEPIRAGP